MSTTKTDLQIGSRKIAVTGGAGFIGSALAKALVDTGVNVTVIDNLCTGSLKNLTHSLDNPNFTFVRADLTNLPDTFNVIEEDCDAVFHLAANPDVRIGSSDTKIDFDNNLLATYNLLEKIRKSRTCKKMIFTSTSTVYGDAEQIPTPEDYGPLLPISLYGASKLACESLISGYSHMFGFKSAILRLANIIGPTSNHGVIFDFVRKLRLNPHFLEILGDGKQNKSYLHIDDCIAAILLAYQSLDVKDKKVQIFNVGSEDRIEVSAIAHIIAEEMELDDLEIYSRSRVNGGRGWSGDVKHMQLDISKIKELGWKAEQQSEKAVRRTVRKLLASQSEKQIDTQKPREVTTS
jgi:UDP-glucose 4-epimerase